MSDTAAEFFRRIADNLDRPLHGPVATDNETDYSPQGTLRNARAAVLTLCGGDAEKAAGLADDLMRQFGGYMPHAAAVALIYAASASGPVAPEVR